MSMSIPRFAAGAMQRLYLFPLYIRMGAYVQAEQRASILRKRYDGKGEVGKTVVCVRGGGLGGGGR